MASKTGKVTIRGRFSPGTTVKLYSRGSADAYSVACGEPIDSAKTDKQGETTFSGPYGNYFAVAEEKVWNHVVGEHETSQRVVDVAIVDRSATAPVLVGEEVGPEPPLQADVGEIIVGARGSSHLDPGTPTRIIDPTTGMVSEFASAVGADQKVVDQSGAVAPRQEDAGKTPLASSTLTGEAVPPKQDLPKQQDAKGPQASDTPDGTATPVEVPKPKRKPAKKAKTSAPKKRAAKKAAPAKKAAKKTQARKRR